MFTFKKYGYEFTVDYEPEDFECNTGDGWFFIDGRVIDEEAIAADDNPLTPEEFWDENKWDLIKEIERFYGEP